MCPTDEVHIEDRDYTSSAAAEQDTSKINLGRPISRAANPLDISLVEALGLIAAAVASAVALRKIRGSSTPFPLAVALALVKIPLGALTAVLGLLFMSGQFVPGLSALDSSAQILAWALVFGYSQQLFARFVDQRAAVLLDKVGGAARLATKKSRPSRQGPGASTTSSLVSAGSPAPPCTGRRRDLQRRPGGGRLSTARRCRSTPTGSRST